MIDIQQQEEMLIAIGEKIEKKISVYAIGGTAMMFRSIKNSTFDVDFVFEKKRDREYFISTLKKLGAKEIDRRLVYGLQKDTPTVLDFENCRFDLFMEKIITSRFSEKMKKRAGQIHEFGNLIIKAADYHDVLIMKSVTSRAKDLEDIINIINKKSINWEIILDEAKEQVALGNEHAILSLGEKLEKLNNQKAIKVPKEVLDELWKLLEKQWPNLILVKVLI